MDLNQLLATYNNASAAKLQTNSDLTVAETAYALAITNLMAAYQSGNPQAINAASTALLTYNSALTSAQVADANASAALLATMNALVTAMVNRLTGG